MHCSSIQSPSTVRFCQSTTPASPGIHSIYEPVTGTWQYLVADPSTLEAVIIDSVLDYDPTTRIISTKTADALSSIIDAQNYTITKILETHIHADHLTAASYLQYKLEREQGFRPPICIGRRITQVQELFGRTYNIPQSEYEEVFEQLFADDEEFSIGTLSAKVIHLPGHTADHVGYIVGDNVFCGDSLFHPSIGTARCDFPGGNASSLYASARKLLSMPDHVKIWTGHDYPSKERGDPVPWMSVGDHKQRNAHVANGAVEEEFVKRRQEKDKVLKEPRLLHESLQINVRAGKLPEKTEGGVRMLRLPIKVEGDEW